MHVPFHTLPESSRLWIYQSDKPINPVQQDAISEVLTTFTTNWEVHGKPMHGSFEIIQNHFVILAADEDINAASGCSIDDSVRVMRALGERLSLDFFNRSNVAFSEGDEIRLIPLAALKGMFMDGSLRRESLMFNTLIQAKSQLKNNWLIPASSSWLKRYLPQESVSH
jgi:hypothetical protein